MLTSFPEVSILKAYLFPLYPYNLHEHLLDVYLFWFEEQFVDNCLFMLFDRPSRLGLRVLYNHIILGILFCRVDKKIFLNDALL